MRALAALTLVLVARPALADQPERVWVDATVRGVAGMEFDDRVLYGPAYGLGADADVRITPEIALGAYYQDLSPSVFSETVSPAPDRHEWLLNGVARYYFSLAPKNPELEFWGELGAGYREHTEGVITSRGIDTLRLGIGFDYRVTRVFRIGGLYDWSTGCFYRRFRVDAGRTTEIESTCHEPRLWVSNWLGVRAGISI